MASPAAVPECPPSGRQWRVGADDAAAILAAYGLTGDGSAPRALGGAVNGVARVGIDGGERFVVVRVHRPETTPDRLAAVHAVQDTLRGHGLPIPAILRTTTGASWTTVDGRLAEVAVFVSGGRQAATWEEGEAGSAMLGRLHAVARGVPTARLPSPAYGCYAAPGTALAMLAATESAFRARTEHPDHARAVAVREETAELLRRLQAARLEYEDALPQGLIHGDYFGANVHFAAGRVIAILDFDRLAVRERVYDLAYALYHLLNRLTLHDLTGRDEHGRLTDRDLARIARLLRRYDAEAGLPLTAAELAALPYEMARAPLYPIAAAGFAADDAGAFADTLGVAWQLPVCRWLVDNAPRVGEAMTQLVGRVHDGEY